MPAGAGFVVKQRARVDKGTRLFRQGERFSAVHLVASGCIKLREMREDGSERIVALRMPGDLIGMEGWACGRHPCTAEAAAPTQLCELQWPHAGSKALSAALLESLLRKTALQLEPSRMWAGLPAVERVAAFLDHCARHLRVSCDVPLTRAEIGSLLGLAEETVVRSIKRLRATGS